MGRRKIEHKKLYVSDKSKKNIIVGFGKYREKLFSWVAKHDLEYFKQIKKLYYAKYSLAKKAKYDEVYSKYCTEIELYDDEKLEEVTTLCVSLRKTNMPISAIRSFLEEKYSELSPIFITKCLHEMRLVLKKEFEIEKDMLVDLHVLRYEELFAKALNPNLSRVPPAYRNSVQAESFINAIEILAQKEKSLGIHTKSFKIQINNYLQSKKKQKVSKFNLDKLSLVQQVELLQLIQGCKQNNIVTTAIKQSSNIEEIKESKVIEATIEAPIKQAQQTDEIGDAQKLEDVEALKVKKGQTFSDVKQSIRNTVQKQIEEAYKRTSDKKKKNN